MVSTKVSTNHYRQTDRQTDRQTTTLLELLRAAKKIGSYLQKLLNLGLTPERATWGFNCDKSRILLLPHLKLLTLLSHLVQLLLQSLELLCAGGGKKYPVKVQCRRFTSAGY